MHLSSRTSNAKFKRCALLPTNSKACWRAVAGSSSCASGRFARSLRSGVVEGGSLEMPYMEESLQWPLSRVLSIMQERIMDGSKYHGIPTLKSPLDFWIYQEILWDTKPEVVI